MPKGKKWTTLEVAHKADWEGLGDMIQNYLDADNIADPELAQLWDDAKDAMQRIDRILEEALNEADGDPEDDEEEIENTDD